MINRKLVVLLNLTWGILFTSIGVLVYVFIISFMRKHIKEIRKVDGIRCIVMKTDAFGGASFGLWYMTGSRSSKYINLHEMGHILQNAIYGPFMLYIAMHSFIRAAFWKKTRIKFYLKHGRYPQYDSIWFERQATDWGLKYFKYIIK